MDLYPDSLVYATWVVTDDVDLTSATAEVFLADAWHAMSWTGAAVQVGSTWTRTCRILVSGANPATGVKPTPADRRPLGRITVGGTVVEKASSLRIDLR